MTNRTLWILVAVTVVTVWFLTQQDDLGLEYISANMMEQ